MTDGDIVGATAGLLGLAIAVDVAGKMMKGASKKLKVKPQKGFNKIKHTKIAW